jgi:signal transduction histidine kinase
VSSLRAPLLRFIVGLGAALLLFIDVQALLQTLHAQARVRDRVVSGSRELVTAMRPRLQALLAPGAANAVQVVAEDAVSAPAVEEFEVFDRSGLRLYAYPRTAPVVHWPGTEDLAAVLAGRVVVVGPVAGAEPRLLAYTQLASANGPLLVRFALSVPEVVQDLRERREILLAHAASLAFVIVGLAFLLLPRREAAAPVPPRALDAYEQAMEKLRDQGQALTREHEAQRLRLQERLEASAPMARAGELTAGMAHEVRNGLGTILGYARLIERGAAAAEAQAAATTIREECEALETVVRRFVDFVKDETLRIEGFDLRRLLSRVAARESRAPGAVVVLEPGPDVRLDGDEEMLERAFENLVRNGREATGPAGHVSISAQATPTHARVTVADDGPGLSPEARGLLRPFLTTKPGGLGLGLPIVYKIVGLHRGEILMGDRASRGLAVTVVLPLEAAPNVTGSSAAATGARLRENR